MSRGLVCEFIAAEKTSYGVRRLCRVFRLSPTSFYAWAARAGGPTAAELRDRGCPSSLGRAPPDLRRPPADR
ncbi:hypothetical protein GCM10023328_47760 [Modestobacter marinus]|uniref:Transposase n=1 Tax=Modestobacter marinus TaxID=477641 RepID=A0ABQ2GAF3_9ACTN|nr:hypothetical protein GCM10011589_45040 [Modestobacter marinus]